VGAPALHPTGSGSYALIQKTPAGARPLMQLSDVVLACAGSRDLVASVSCQNRVNLGHGTGGPAGRRWWLVHGVTR